MKKKDLRGEDYGFPNPSWKKEDLIYYEMSNSSLREAYRLYEEKKIGDGPKILDEIFRRVGKTERIKAFLKGADFDWDDLKSLDLFYASNKMNINPEDIFRDRAVKEDLLKNILGYHGLVYGKDKLTGKIKYKPLNSCEDERIGKVFLSRYKRGKTLDKLIED